MSDLGDFLGNHPVPRAPVKVVRDPTIEAFRDETSHRAARTPTATQRRSGFRLEVAQQPCKAGACKHPPGTLCGNVDFEPDPSLDEIGVGWTAQHIPREKREAVPVRCILCWAETPYLEQHACEVLALLAVG